MISFSFLIKNIFQYLYNVCECINIHYRRNLFLSTKNKLEFSCRSGRVMEGRKNTISLLKNMNTEDNIDKAAL
ncbi:MAG TPA: hypothetical protein DD738_02095 [Ruminiclostridium sp.]|nr:hypothetical protein [Ruminiclostridium sp.]